MNKKFLSVLVTVFMFVNMFSNCFAAKKDVADPVLQQIISELSSRMPRFINKYGAAVFVADENITRGALLQALYEFDKKSSASSSASSDASVGVVSKKDYDALNAKVIALEKKIRAGGVSSGSSSKSQSVDLVEIMDDLEVNMPMLLDNTLADSKVFKALEKKVNAAGGAAVASTSGSTASSSVSQTALTSLQKNVAALTKKVDDVELSLASVKKSGSAKGSKDDSFASSAEFTNLQKNMDALTKKVDNVELSLASVKKSGSTKGSKENLLYSSTDITNLQKNMDALTKKVDDVELSLASVKSSAAASLKGSGTKNTTTDAQMLYDFKNFQKEIDAVNKKVSSMELKLAKSKTDSSIYNGPSQEDFNSLKKTIIQMNQSYISVGKRLDNLEKEQQIVSASNNSSSSASSLSAKQMQLINARINSIRQSVDDIKAENISKYSSTKNTADIKSIEKRLSNLEKTDKASYTSSGSAKGSDSGSNKASTVAKISLGLSMVAALFVAR